MMNYENLTSMGYDIVSFCAKIGLPEESQGEVFPVCEKIILDYYPEYKAINADRMNGEKYAALAAEMNIEPDLSMLAVSVLLGIDAHPLYREHGIGDDVYYDSMREITIWAKVCQKERGHTGIYGHEWLNNFMSLYIVRLKRLEFQESEFADGLTWEKHGVSVKPGDTVINIHIPEDGGLCHDDVIESYRRAYRHFGREGLAVFVCHTWLLYPGNYDFLPQTSNIRAFMDDFDIIKREDMKNCPDLWRVFGRRESYVTSELPKDTSLRLALADYLETHDNVTGYGYGVFAFDGEHVLK